MSFFHFTIYFHPLNTISLNFRESTNIPPNNQIKRILFLHIFKKIIENNDLFYHFTMWMIALRYMNLHLLNYSLSLFLDKIHVLLLINLILLSLHLVFYLLHCVSRKGSEFLLHLGLDIFVVLENLMLFAVVFFLLVHLQLFFRNYQIIIKQTCSKFNKRSILCSVFKYCVNAIFYVFQYQYYSRIIGS